MAGLYVASNPTALSAQFQLQRNMGSYTDTLTRLSTGLKINTAKDDPAGLIASELLKSDIVATNKAITNTERANSMIAVADSALGQISSLLNDIRGLVVESANTGTMSDSQIEANQLQIDASIDAIDRIARQTNYQGQKLLDGSMDFTTNICGGQNSSISDLVINSANFGTEDSLDVTVKVQEAAKKGTLIYNGTGVDEITTIDVTGSTGSKTFTFGAGTTTKEMATAINAARDSTGVAAYVEGEASRGTVTLSSTGANNDIVVTANEEGFDAGNYAFKIVSGDQEGARIVSDPTDGSPGVVEIMLKTGYQKSYQNLGGILDVTIKSATAPDADNGASGVTIKKGTVNQAVLHEDNAGAAGTSQDGGKTLTVLGDDDAAATAVAWTDMSKLNGWTIKAVAAGDYANKELAAAGDYALDSEAKVAYVMTTAAGATAADFGAALGAIVGNATVNGAAVALTGTIVAGDEFKLGGGGAAGELEITYKEGATVNDILKVANNASGNAVASLASGVNGDALVKDVLTGESRMFTANGVDAMTKSKYTSTATANDVINLINSNLGDKFTATLKTNDSGAGLVGFMDASAISGSVNSDNAIRFSGMDSGPVVRMVTMNADGTKIINQKLSVQLINPSEADIAAGRTTQILQVNLATDASGNSITTAQDIVDLFNSLTPEQTGGISASLVLPDGVDPNGRTWYKDPCDNELMTTDCNATYGKGIVQPTGKAGPCEITENDLVLLGENQSLVKDQAVARIGTVADHSGAPIGGSEALIGTAAEGVETVSNHSGLAGVKINWTTDANQAGFDEATGTLNVYASPETQALAAAGDLSAAMTDALNGAIAQNWQGIRQFNGATGNATTVTLTTAGATYAAASASQNGLDAFATATTGAAATSTRGINATDPALTIKAINKGTEMAGVKVVLENDSTMAARAASGDPAPEIGVTFDKDTGTLTIRANGADGISAGALAAALNANDVFKANFTAEATSILDDADPTAGGLVDADWGTVYFGDAMTSATTFTGGLKIQTEEKATGGATNTAETSNGLAMTGNNDDNQRLVLEATETGSKNFVKVNVAQGSFTTYCPLGLEMCELAGTDVVATINGMKARGEGNKISLNTSDLSLSMNVANEAGETSFTITGGGATFQLGPNVVSSQQLRVALPNMTATHLGGTSGKLFQLRSGGEADMFTNTTLADSIINEAIGTVTSARGRLGAIQRSTLDPNIASLQDSLVAMSEAEAMYTNADFAEEAANMARYQILVQAGANVLAQANQIPQYGAMLVG